MGITFDYNKGLQDQAHFRRSALCPGKKDFSSPDNSKHFRSLLVLNQPVPEIPIFILVSELIKTFFNCPGFPLISILIKKFLVWYWNMSYKTRQNPFENLFLKGVLNIGAYKNLSRKFPFVTFQSCLVPFFLQSCPGLKKMGGPYGSHSRLRKVKKSSLTDTQTLEEGPSFLN